MKRINKIRIKYALLISFFIILATVLPTFMRYQASITANVVGYAKETRRSTYKVNFHSNGGTGTMASMTVNYNEAVNLIPNTFTNEPSHFAGWNTQADGEWTPITASTPVGLSANWQTLYAQWTPNEFVKIQDIDEQTRIANLLDGFEKLVADISEGLPAEIKMRHQQYEYYRDKLLTFKRLEAVWYEQL